MTSIEAKLDALGLVLPTPKPALANYLPYVISGNMLYLSGQGPVTAAGDPIKGQLGDALDIEEGARAAQLSALNIVAQVKQAVEGDWSRVQRCVRRVGKSTVCAVIPKFCRTPSPLTRRNTLCRVTWISCVT